MKEVVHVSAGRLAINVGGTFSQMTVIYPEWSGQLPESLVTFFSGGTPNRILPLATARWMSRLL